MFAYAFITWWYGAGWSGVLRATGKRVASLAETFSVAMLLRTLFSPWKRIITYPGASLQDHLRAFVDNLISRFVGFFVRISVLFCAGVFLFLLLLLGLAEIVIWPLLPAASVVLVIKGLL